MEDRIGPRAALQQLRDDLPQIRDSIRKLPGIVRYLSEQIEHDRLNLDVRASELEKIHRQLKLQQRQRFTLAASATVILSGTLIVTLAATTWPGWLLITGGVLTAFTGRPGQ